MILAIDFDNVIHDQKNPVEGRKMGPPMTGAVDALQYLYAAHTIIIHTTMANTPSGRKAVADWLEYYDIDYHELAPKVSADLYLDDRNIRHTSWAKSLQEVEKRLK